MAREARRWKLEDLIDFEQALHSKPEISADDRARVSVAAADAEGAEARRRGLLAWLDRRRPDAPVGRRFSAALSVVALGLAALAFCAGASATLGMLDPARGGINVTLFLAILIGGQWGVLSLAGVAWMFRRKAGEGFSGLQSLAGKVARKFAGGEEHSWWRAVMDGGGAPRAAVLWRLARMAQGAGVAFNLGIIAALGGLVLLRHVGFFWETTTERAMEESLTSVVRVLSFPWASGWAEAVPDGSTVAESRWLPGRSQRLDPGPAEWWRFLLATTFVWGLLPRAVLWFLACYAGRSALRRLDFQARHHRALWRDLTGAGRTETSEKALDGVLVLDVGGSGFSSDSLRPFLLRRLRVHPAAWHSVAVLDAGAEAEAAEALTKSPAGVVLVAEGWALSPPRMVSLHRRIRDAAGKDAPIKFLVANLSGDGSPAAPSCDERKEWERFVDSLRDPGAEVFFFDAGA